MQTNIQISIVIPTYNRSNYLLKILDCLKKNKINFRNFEIIICDSFSKDSTSAKVMTFKNQNEFMNISYINIFKNLHSIKRNLGIKFSRGKYIIFLDDDCFPERDFLKQYCSVFSKEKNNKNIFCGSVLYKQKINNKNFEKYRQSRQFLYKKTNYISDQNLDASKIVTMNMGFKNKKLFLNKDIFFNKKFNIYGFEDYELGFRLIKNNYKIKACSPTVYHNDNRSFYLYLKKIFFLGLESMNYLININLEAAKNNNFYKLESNLIIKFLLKFNFFHIVLNLLKELAIYIEKNFLYLPFIYKMGIASSYLLGCSYRKKKYLLNDLRYKNWYK
jgi:glycosyltransferase involved in cell wall biosynthesis